MKRSPLKRSGRLKQGKGFAVSKAQREKVKDAQCVVCLSLGCDPAHLVDRVLDKDGDPRWVIPLCRTHHRAYDYEGYDLLPYESEFREEMAWAVLHYGSVHCVKRVANNKGIQF
jgi:hypothetical protein